MTNIVYDRQGLRLSMEGHALANDYGSDIICAAESMLMMCLEKRLMDYGEGVMMQRCKGPGKFSIQALPDEENEVLCRESFDTIFSGCMLLAQYEPEYVRATMLWEEEEQDEN